MTLVSGRSNSQSHLCIFSSTLRAQSAAGEAVAPYFAIGMVFFLMLFVAYFVLAVVSIAVDFDAMDAPCAEVKLSDMLPSIQKQGTYH